MSLKERIQQLAQFETVPFPVVSLYLDTRADQHGRSRYEPYVRKEFAARAKSFPLRSVDRESFENDSQRIQTYLAQDLPPSVNTLALFACSAADAFFEAIPLEAGLGNHFLFVSNRPHLYPLAKLDDQFARYAAVVVDSQSARLFVFGLAEVLGRKEVQGARISRTQVGGWSQARYQRHVDNLHLQHFKEVAQALDELMRTEDLQKLILAGDDVTVAALKEQLPVHLSEKIVDTLRLDMKTPENEVLSLTLEAIKQDDAQSDAEVVQRLFSEFRSGGLGVVGAKDTLSALQNGQVDQLILSASLKEFRENPANGDSVAGNEADFKGAIVAEQLVNGAHQTSAKVKFIEDPALLKEIGGVGALLRYRL
jgi:peptide chain release factor subunit 1